MGADGLPRRPVLAMGAAGVLSAALPRAAAGSAPPARQPNILLIVADDLGYSDLGAFGGEVRTPHLDALARSGTRLTNFHTAAGCAPTRAMLMGGVDHHRTGLACFPELIDTNQLGKPGYEGYLRPDVVCVAEPMREAGYHTVMVGKWHLGVAASADPSARGFERSFVLPGGGASHFGVRLDGKPGPDAEYREDGKKLEALPAGFYSTDAYTAKMIEYLGEAPKDKPFFAYLAYTAPHFPLQVPPEDLALYRGRYDGGWGRLKADRLPNMAREGVLPAGAVVDAAAIQATWDQLGPDARAVAARMMEVYAAMIDRLDRQIGRLVDWLEQDGRLDDTIILFMADNGPEGTELDKGERTAAMAPMILAGADNSLGSIGGPRSYVWYGPGWAHACAAPFRMFKHFPTEGGIRVPAFIVTPGRPQVSHSDAYAFVTDIPVTLLDWAGGKVPDGGDGEMAYTGASLAGLVAGRVAAAHPATVPGGWELWGRRAYREGRWKAFLIPDHTGSGQWELYDVEADPSESRDLAQAEPELLARLIDGWARYAQSNGVVLPNILGQ